MTCTSPSAHPRKRHHSYIHHHHHHSPNLYGFTLFIDPCQPLLPSHYSSSRIGRDEIKNRPNERTRKQTSTTAAPSIQSSTLPPDPSSHLLPQGWLAHAGNYSVLRAQTLLRLCRSSHWILALLLSLIAVCNRPLLHLVCSPSMAPYSYSLVSCTIAQPNSPALGPFIPTAHGFASLILLVVPFPQLAS